MWGAGLSRFLTTEGVTVIEVDRPDRGIIRCPKRYVAREVYRTLREPTTETRSAPPTVHQWSIADHACTRGRGSSRQGFT